MMMMIMMMTLLFRINNFNRIFQNLNEGVRFSFQIALHLLVKQKENFTLHQVSLKALFRVPLQMKQVAQISLLPFPLFCTSINVMFKFLFQLSSLSKHRDDQDTKEANSLQFKNALEARYFMILQKKTEFKFKKHYIYNNIHEKITRF